MLAGSPARRFFLVTVALALSVTWFRPGPRLLVGGDSGIYARIARELAERPLSTWLQLTLDAEPFFEHPPLALWVEACAFSLFGASVPVAVGVARAWASLTVVLLALGARRLRAGTADEGWLAGGLAASGALVLPGFLYTSQVAMFEMPLAALLALGVFALGGLCAAPPGARVGPDVGWWCLAVCGGFWVKGPPVLVLFGVSLGLVALKELPWRRGLAAVFAAVGAVLLSVVAFESLRERAGLEAFFPRYLVNQVLASLTKGRHNPVADPLFYVAPLLNWYTPALLALGLAVAFSRRAPRRLALTGGLLFGGIVLGFSAAAQKYQWYVHPVLVGGALVIAAVLLVGLREAWVPRLSAAVLSAAVTWPLLTLAPWTLTGSELAIERVQRAAPPRAGMVVADCSGMEAWAATHLQGFAWRSRRVECEAPAELRWDGEAFAATAGTAP